MPKLSLMEIVSHLESTGSKQTVTRLDRSVQHYEILALCDISNYVSTIVTDHEARAINAANAKIMHQTAPYKIHYNSFQETPIYHRLEGVSQNKFVLRDMLNEYVADQVAQEIRVAVINGFEQDLQKYVIHGIASYPPEEPIKFPVMIAKYDMSPISAMTSQYPDIRDGIKAIINKHVYAQLDDTMKYLSYSLQQYHEIDSVKICIDFINSYGTRVPSCRSHNGDKRTLLESVLSDPYGRDHTTLILLYQKYGKKIGGVTEVIEAVPAVIDCHLERRDTTMLSFYRIKPVVNMLFDLKMEGEYSKTLCKIFSSQVCNDGELFFEMIFRLDNSLFKQLIKMSYREIVTLFKEQCEGGEDTVLYHILHKGNVEMFRCIAENCNIKTLIHITNIAVVNSSGLSTGICHKLDDPQFSAIVLGRVEDIQKLEEINDPIDYCVSAFEIDRELALSCAINIDEADDDIDIKDRMLLCFLDSFLKSKLGQPKMLIGEYIFSADTPEARELVKILKAEFLPDEMKFLRERDYGVRFHNDSGVDEEVNLSCAGDIRDAADVWL